MSARMNLGIVTLSSLLLFSTACSKGKSGSSASGSVPVKKSPQVSAVCEGIQCLNSITWKILLQGQVFPEKVRVDINGNTVLDECLGKQQYRIDRDAAPQSLTLENFFVPKPGKVNIHVVDLGYSCDKETTFVFKKKVKWEVVKGAHGQELEINL